MQWNLFRSERGSIPSYLAMVSVPTHSVLATRGPAGLSVRSVGPLARIGGAAQRLDRIRSLQVCKREVEMASGSGSGRSGAVRRGAIARPQETNETNETNESYGTNGTDGTNGTNASRRLARLGQSFRIRSWQQPPSVRTRGSAKRGPRPPRQYYRGCKRERESLLQGRERNRGREYVCTYHGCLRR